MTKLPDSIIENESLDPIEYNNFIALNVALIITPMYVYTVGSPPISNLESPIL